MSRMKIETFQTSFLDSNLLLNTKLLNETDIKDRSFMAVVNEFDKIAKTSSQNLHNTNNLCANEVNETVFSIWGDSF